MFASMIRGNSYGMGCVQNAPHKNPKLQMIKPKSHSLFALFLPQWRVCTFDCARLGTKGMNAEVAYSFLSVGRSWHTDTRTSPQQLRLYVSFFIFKWTMANVSRVRWCCWIRLPRFFHLWFLKTVTTELLNGSVSFSLSLLVRCLLLCRTF